MNILGFAHIILSVLAYALYGFVFLKYLAKSYPLKILHIANVTYLVGFVVGMVWANIEWGYMLSWDPKVVLSILVPIPFVLESIFKKKDVWIVGMGCLLIMLNYLLPLIIGTIHTH